MPEEKLEEYGAFNISLVVDLPLFIDPFLLFQSKKGRYQELHAAMITYLRYLRDEASIALRSNARLRHLYCFPEITQNWLGFSLESNRGRGLGMDFATALAENLDGIFESFGDEEITRGTHLEKLCLIKEGVGRDMISDFTTNLIKGFLCEYTQEFSVQNLDESSTDHFSVSHAGFDYGFGRWYSKTFVLPKFGNHYVLLTPKDILSKDDTWINKTDFVREYNDIPTAIPNEELRDRIDAYFQSVLPPNPSAKEAAHAVQRTALKFPELIDYYIRFKENRGSEAELRSTDKVGASFTLFVEQARQLVRVLETQSDFYKEPLTSKEAARSKVLFLKDVIENKGGHRLFYSKGQPIKREEDLQILYRLVWHGTKFDVSREVNDGRGPADFKISHGATDKTVVEMKLASNRSLKRNLQKQAELYQKASDAESALKIILFFDEHEERRTIAILKELGLDKSKDIFLIDARSENKPTGSTA